MWSSTHIWRGIAAIVTGLTAAIWPGITVGAFVVLFAVYCFTGAAHDFAAAFRKDRHAGPAVAHLLLAFIACAAGLSALVLPGLTALLLAEWIAAWAPLAGLLEIGFTLRPGEGAGHRARWIVSGLITFAFGLVLAVRPGAGALTLATLFGFYSVVYGAANLAMAGPGRRNHPITPRPGRPASG